jgi:predicted RNA-binding Zn-ribbon protein involved in translation (DUF1610 family)
VSAGGSGRHVSSYLDRPHISSQDYGLPMRCPKPECGFGWLKLPGVKMITCPNCGAELISTRPKKRR